MDGDTDYCDADFRNSEEAAVAAAPATATLGCSDPSSFCSLSRRSRVLTGIKTHSWLGR